jgi:hypothetical protein
MRGGPGFTGLYAPSVDGDHHRRPRFPRARVSLSCITADGMNRCGVKLCGLERSNEVGTIFAGHGGNVPHARSRRVGADRTRSPQRARSDLRGLAFRGGARIWIRQIRPDMLDVSAYKPATPYPLIHDGADALPPFPWQRS